MFFRNLYTACKESEFVQAINLELGPKGRAEC